MGIFVEWIVQQYFSFSFADNSLCLELPAALAFLLYQIDTEENFAFSNSNYEIKVPR